MENTAKIVCGLFLAATLFFVSCQNNKRDKNVAVAQVQEELVPDTTKFIKNQDSIKCANNPIRFTITKNHLLFRDSLSGLYLRRKNNVPINPDRPLSKCQKLPFGFVNAMVLLNDSVVTIDDILDLDSFKKLRNTDVFYKDEKKTYAYQEDPVSYPAFSEIEVNPEKVRIIDSLYIKDNITVYFQGIRLNIADAKSFTSQTYRDSLGEKLTLVYDRNNIYHLGKPYSVERLDYLALHKKQLDSIRAIYFR